MANNTGTFCPSTAKDGVFVSHCRTLGLLAKPGFVRNGLNRDSLRRLLQGQIRVRVGDFVAGHGCAHRIWGFRLAILS
jgi:hypothetical protein